MSVQIWRICKAARARQAFSGDGAAGNPGRWNPAGRKAVYCAESRALATLEVLAHVEDRAILRRARYVAIAVTVPEELIWIPKQVPSDWRNVPMPASTQRFGERFFRHGSFPVMRVPSAVVSGEFCYVLNPEHPRFNEIKIGKPEPISFDSRVVRPK